MGIRNGTHLFFRGGKGVFNKFIKKATKTATVVVKKEMHKGVNDGVSKGIKVGTFIAGLVLFATRGKAPKSAVKSIAETSAKVVNNYYIIGKEFLK